VSQFAIGDVHGNYQLLSKLLINLEKRISKDDILIFLGDIIDGGAQSKECVDLIIQFMKSTPAKTITIMGNHEQWLLETRNDFSKHSWIISMEGLRTIESYSETAAEKIKTTMKETGPDLIIENLPLPYDLFFESIPGSHMKFFEEMKNYHETEIAIFTHAGVDPEIIELENMDDRKFKWGFEGFPEKYKGHKTVVYGHYSNKAIKANGMVKPYIIGNTVCIDTQSHGVLSAIQLPEKKLLQVK
jgi:serine/threonine protein phosphatase 1